MGRACLWRTWPPCPWFQTRGRKRGALLTQAVALAGAETLSLQPAQFACFFASPSGAAAPICTESFGTQNENAIRLFST